MSFVEKIKSASSDLVYLVKGYDNGRSAWHYVRVKNKTLLPIFLKKTDGGSIDVSKYGEILCSGWGKNPPEEVAKKFE